MEAVDYFSIQNLLNRYFHYVDTGDFERCGQLFAKANLIYVQSGKVYSKDPIGVAKQMQSFVKLYGEDQTPQTHHHSGNMIIEQNDEKSVHTSCSAIIYQSTKSLPFQAIASASYEDRFEKSLDGWVYTQRKMKLNFTGDMSHHLLRKVSND